jgi:hypothetical protein
VVINLPLNIVEIFIGATSYKWLSETPLKEFTEHTSKPCVCFVRRSQEAGARIFPKVKSLNPEGSYEFREAAVSLKSLK